jgi:hypothetical protein
MSAEATPEVMERYAAAAEAVAARYVENDHSMPDR